MPIPILDTVSGQLSSCLENDRLLTSLGAPESGDNPHDAMENQFGKEVVFAAYLPKK